MGSRFPALLPLNQHCKYLSFKQNYPIKWGHCNLLKNKHQRESGAWSHLEWMARPLPGSPRETLALVRLGDLAKVTRFVPDGWSLPPLGGVKAWGGSGISRADHVEKRVTGRAEKVYFLTSHKNRCAGPLKWGPGAHTPCVCSEASEGLTRSWGYGMSLY